MKKNALLAKVENYGLIIISAGIALLYLRIDSLELGDASTLWITVCLFIGYGSFTQYFINSQKRMEAEIISLSITDYLTGLYNRRGFMTLAEQQIKMVGRTDKKSLLLLLFADLDKMKSINDNLGHKKGDNALIEVASILKKVFRESDIVARIGGDEFAVLGLVAEKSDIAALESRLQEQIDIHNAYENRDYAISLSVGIACGDPGSRYSIDDLMSKADQLMYEQKRRKPS
jgi:two-component system, cell cycle response regulator